MNTDDIENLLQQYGDSRRQQDKAAQRLRHLARQGAHGRRTAVCLLLLAAAGIYLFRAPKSAETLMAEAESTTAPQPAAVQPSQPVQPATSSHIDNPIPGSPHFQASVSPSDTTAVASSAHLPGTSATAPSAVPSATPDTPPAQLDVIAAQQEEQPLPSDTLVPSPFAMPSVPLLADQPSLAMAEPRQQGARPRLRFTAGIGAAVAAGTASPATNLTNVSSFSGADFIDIQTDCSPTGALSAQAGVSYALLQGQWHHFDVGLTLGGCTQQYQVTQTTGPATDHPTQVRYQASVQSLFLHLPLTLHNHRHGSDRAGWQLSLTPARQVLTTQSGGPTALNPWRLTLGLGASLPHSWIHAISLTADMLPAYQNIPMHQFGISIEY